MSIDKNMKNLVRFGVLLFLFPVELYASECVILLHGLARTDASMSKLEKILDEAGYKAVNVKYPSRKYKVEKLADVSISSGLDACGNTRYINFVTHSMGGILVRQYLSKNQITNLKHVVMLGPPNKGSEVVDKLGDFPGFKAVNGPAGIQLGRGEMSVPNKLGEAHFSLGVIAGSKSINFLLSTMIPGADDGKVSVESTKLEGMQDHITMPVTHTFMMKNNKVIEQVIYFLKYGVFKEVKR